MGRTEYQPSLFDGDNPELVACQPNHAGVFVKNQLHHVYSPSSKKIDPQSSDAWLEDNVCLIFATDGDRWYYGYRAYLGGEHGQGMGFSPSTKVWPAKGKCCAAGSFQDAKHMALQDAIATIQGWADQNLPDRQSKSERISRLLAAVTSGSYQEIVIKQADIEDECGDDIFDADSVGVTPGNSPV